MNRKKWLGLFAIIILMAGGWSIKQLLTSITYSENKQINDGSSEQKLNTSATSENEKPPIQNTTTTTEFKEEVIPKPTLKEQGISITQNGDASLLTDKQTNISFSYPTAWGPIEIEEEKCVGVPTIEDPCNMRMYIFSSAKYAGVFLVTETTGHHQNPPGRDGFWGDGAGSITKLFTDECTPKNKCELITNKEGTIIAKQMGLSEYGDNNEADGMKRRKYYTFSDKGPYHGFILTASRFSAPGSAIEKQFEDVVISSLKFSTN